MTDVDSSKTVCGCRIPSGYAPKFDALNPAAQDCPFCDGTGFLIRTTEKKTHEDITIANHLYRRK